MARRFRGESDHKVDTKGRVSIPASFRRVIEACDPEWTEGLAPRIIIVYGGATRDYLEGFTIEAMNEVDDKIAAFPVVLLNVRRWSVCIQPSQWK